MSSKLNLNIREIDAEGRDVSADLDDGEVRQLLGGTGLPLAEGNGHAHLRGQVRLINDGAVLLQGRLDGQLWTECSRCLGPAAVQLCEPELRRVYLPEHRADRVLEEVELSEEDLDVAMHDGEQIDLSVMVRDSLVLAVPIAPLCQPDCAGVRVDDHGDEEQVPHWKAALQQIKERLDN